MLIPAHFGKFFGFDHKYSQILPRPEKAHLSPETRVLSYRSSRSVKKHINQKR